MWCTKAPLEKQVLAVGDSTKLEIIFSTKRYKGKVTKQPRIKTNEGPPDKHVRIITNIVPRPDSTYPIVIDPYKLDLSQFSEKVVKKKKFTITNVSDQKLDVSLAATCDDFFKLKLPKSIKPGKTEEGELELKKEAYGEPFQKSVTIEVVGVDDGKATRFTIPVKRTIHIAEATPDTKTPPGKH
ncbi:MAG: hypothetical protein ACE5K8_09845 [Candidatus Zixiibacteriota bacterium]